MVSVLKKGTVETSALVGLASVLFIGFILFVFIKNSAVVNVDVTAKETCKRSVQQYAKWKLPGIDLTRTDTIKCPTQSIQINSADEERAKSGIAKAMFDCFDQFGADELELFDTRRGSTDNYCVVCSKLTFTEKGKEVRGLVEYLTTTTIPGQKKTYYEFLKGGAASEAEVKTVESVVPVDIIDASKPHAVMFAYGKTTGWWDKISAGAIAGTAGLVVGGAVAGFFTGGVGWVVAAAAVTGGAGTVIAVAKAPYLESDWQAGVLVMPYDETIKESLRKAGTTCSEIPIK
ncbi:hypothetical protein HYU20_00045 [Candidatus Woesearchaeota archaeon]|nr:hypothetical protein [Candidatus Woesearchaeota archaeon]